MFRVLFAVVMLLGLSITSVEAHSENGGTNNTFTFVADTSGGNCDGWVFASKRPEGVGGGATEFEGVFLVSFDHQGTNVPCDFELSVVQYLDNGGIKYIAGSITNLSDPGTSDLTDVEFRSDPTVGCTNSLSETNHNRFASAVFIEGGSFDENNDGVGDGFSAWGGGTIRNHWQCPAAF